MTEVATFGAGCFWGVEAAFRRLPGVVDVASGYSGGHTPNPTYKDVCSHTTGHAEVVQVTFDPQKITYDQLLDLLADPQSNASEPPGTRRWHAIPLRNLRSLARAAGHRGEIKSGTRSERQISAPYRHRNHRGRSFLSCGRVPPKIPGKAWRRILPFLAGFRFSFCCSAAHHFLQFFGVPGALHLDP